MPPWPQPALPAQWSGTTPRPPLVGRAREFERLEEVWACVLEGAPQIVLVGGEAGAGKSRLASEAAWAVHRAGAAVLLGSCEPDLRRPFDPFVDPARVLLAAVDEGVLQLPAPAPGGGPGAADLLRVLVGQRSGPARGSSGGPAAVAMFEPLADTLEAACLHRPTLLVLEDLHWAGESALRLLRYLVAHLGSARLLVLGTHRTTPPDRSDLLSEVLADLSRRDDVHRLDLGALAVEDITEYLVASGAGSARELRAVSSLLRDHTGGNPFVLREAWRDVQARGGMERLRSGSLQVPDSLRAVLTGRLAALQPALRRLVCLGAVVGEAYDVASVAAAADDPAVTIEQVYEAMEQGCAAGVVEPVPDRPGIYRFPHALARQAVQDELSAYELAAAHAAIGLALERAPQGEPSRMLRMAHHFSLAPGLGLEDRAARYLRAAAEAAESQFALSDAASLYERAAAHASGPDERDHMLLAAARCLHLAGRVVRARALDEELATSSSSPAVRLRAAIGFEAASWRAGSDGPRAVALLRGALATSDRDEEDPLAVRATGALASALTMSGEGDSAVEVMEDALARARRRDDGALLAAVLRTSLWVGTGPEHVAARAERAAELVTLARREGLVAPMAAAATVRVQTGYVLGDARVVEEGVTDLRRSVEESRQPYWRWTASLVTTSLQTIHGRLDEAEQTLRDGRRIEAGFETGQEGRADGPSSLQEFVLRRETGRLEVARRALASGVPVERPWRPGLVALCTELGLADLGRRTLHEALDRDLTVLRSSVAWPASLSFLGEAAAWLGDRAAMELLLPEAERYAGHNLMGSELLALLGSADLLTALLRAALGRPGVEPAFTAALDLDRRTGSVLHEATTHAHWAAYLSRTGAPADRVREHEVSARRAATHYGLARVLRLLGPAEPATAPDGLTTREVEVLRLLAEGASNRDIATRLVISEHTAANHVRSILMKTQSPNRTSAARYAARHDLLAGESDDRRE